MGISCIGDVRKKVLSQHSQIRAQIHDLERMADTATSASNTRTLQSSLARFAAGFDAHLQFEERELAPKVREVDAWGPVREATLRAEHADQRARLESLCSRAEEPAPGARIAGDVLQLATSLLADMEAEERWLAELADLEVYGHIDQMTG